MITYDFVIINKELHEIMVNSNQKNTNVNTVQYSRNIKYIDNKL